MLQTQAELGKNHPSSGKYAPVNPQNWATANYPLGANYRGKNVTFAVYSENASHILLEIYSSATGENAKYDYWLKKNPDDNIWRGEIAEIPHGTYYGFRCWGSNWQYDKNWCRGNSKAGFQQDVDEQGNRFNPNKVLFDPYAKELSHDIETPAMFETGQSVTMYATGDLDYQGVKSREYDTGKWCPKGIIITQDTRDTGKRPFSPPENSAIYEAHVRGLTIHPSSSNLREILEHIEGGEAITSVPPAYRGTYLGAAFIAPYLKMLGFTTIELLPVQETANDSNPDDEAGGNYWGYMTFGYFAPDRRYAYDKSPGGPTREFKQMVKAFHEQGIEVYLDVVFNHTGEGGNWENNRDITGFVSFGGFDVTSYYQLTNDNCIVDGATGCGNQLNFSNQVTQNLVVDSLKYWIREMGVDGFRFDLATVLGRKPNQFERENWQQLKQFFPQHPLLRRIRELGDSYQVEVIAEAWDIWGYEVGKFPSGWGEWNGRYRDAIRQFMKGEGNTRNFMEQVNGDYENYNDSGGPQRSINLIVAHDGFNLTDLVSYNQKNNYQRYPFGISDGGNDGNLSWDSDGNHRLRRQRLRNFWTIQFLSRGVPMVVWGDEFGRTQNGNNNPYNLDSVATWNNYNMINTNAPNTVDTGFGGSYHNNFGRGDNRETNINPLFIFARYMANLRRRHNALRQYEYADMELDAGEDVTYLFTCPDGNFHVQNGDRCLRLLIDGSEVKDYDFLVLINMWIEPVNFNVPSEQSATHQPPQKWRRIIDTASWAEPEYNCWSLKNAQIIENNYTVQPWSIAVLMEV